MKCLVALKRYTECLAVIEDELQRSPSNVDLIIARAQLNVLFGDVSDEGIFVWQSKIA